MVRANCDKLIDLRKNMDRDHQRHVESIRFAVQSNIESEILKGKAKPVEDEDELSGFERKCLKEFKEEMKNNGQERLKQMKKEIQERISTVREEQKHVRERELEKIKNSIKIQNENLLTKIKENLIQENAQREKNIIQKRKDL